MNINELSKIIHASYEEKYGLLTFTNIKTDTNSLTKNDIFLAINSGHDYLKEIKKCRGVIVENDFKSDKFPVLRVNDTKKSLENIALYKRNNYKGKIIAITGSNGKTTTKELLSHILKSKYSVFKSYKNMNNKLGVLINMLSLDKSEISVFELGMNHRKEISELSKLIRPDIAIITNIGTAHIGYLGSKENIYKAKLEIIDGMNEVNLYVNGDDKYLRRFNQARKICLKNDLFEINNVIEYPDYLKFNLKIQKNYHIKYHISSIAQLSNVALAIYVSLALGVKPSKISSSLNSFKPIKDRMEVIKLRDKIIINDSYNSNYESLMAGISSLKNYSLDKICIIGSILELGSSEKQIYKKISCNLNKEYFYIFVGNKIKASNAIYLDNVEELIDYYNLHTKEFKDKVIYVKASHTVGLCKFVDELIK